MVIMQILFTNNVYISYSYISDTFYFHIFKHNLVTRQTSLLDIINIIINSSS